MESVVSEGSRGLVHKTLTQQFSAVRLAFFLSFSEAVIHINLTKWPGNVSPHNKKSVIHKKNYSYF